MFLPIISEELFSYQFLYWDKNAMMVTFVLWGALGSQVVSALLALRMFRTYGRYWVWLLVALAAVGVACRSGQLCGQLLGAPHFDVHDLPAETSAFAMSLLLMFGLSVVNGIFRVRLKTEEALHSEKRRLSMLVDRRVADLETEVADRKRAEDALRLDGERFSAIIATQYDIATAERDLPAIMDLIVARTQRLTHATGAILLRVEHDDLVYRAVSGRAGPFLGTRVGSHVDICGECVRTGKTLRCDDAERDSRVSLDLFRRMGVRSTVVVPLHYDRAVVGVLQVTSPELYAFTAMDEHTLHLMAGLMAAAMSHAAEFEAKQELLAHKERLLAEAIEQADRDPLTGLLNHRAFHKRLEEEADRAQRTGERVALAVIDLDNFKFFNDAYGHLVGDEVLKQVARAITRVSRSYDTLARYGGDEFALLLPGIGAESAGDITARLMAAFENLEYRPVTEGGTIPLTLSTGVAVFPDDGPGRLEALETADARLLRVKYGGGMSGELTEQLRTQLSCSMANFSMLNALVTAVDTKDRYTRRHSEDVMCYSHQIACQMGLNENECNQVLMAALLHDVGKIGVPNYILRKPGNLTDEEYRAIKQHPMMGAVIVGAVSGLENTLDAIRHHHERWDGQGYPYGLRGEETPLPARLMAVADAYSALTTDRPYRKGMDAARARAILDEGAGSQWDPACVAAFLSISHNPQSSSASLPLASKQENIVFG
ncbi:MAG: diguanylate cyclase domain-containing protein [Janthinobacterium lividum]